MPRQITCESCGAALLSFESLGPEPIEREQCPNCGETEFTYD